MSERGDFAAAGLPRTLRARRANPPPFQGRFYERHEDFLPLRIGNPRQPSANGAVTFTEHDAWPALSELDTLLRVLPFPLRVVDARTLRRPRGVADADALYDAHIVRRGVLPTRPRDWHDFLNALTWLAFPRAKLALHTRQLAELERAIAAHGRLPNARSPLHDTLAVLDEGGMLELTDGTRARRFVFGHAIHEGRVYGVRAVVARVLPLTVARVPDDDRDALALCDEAFARLLPSLSVRVRELALARLTG